MDRKDIKLVPGTADVYVSIRGVVYSLSSGVYKPRINNMGYGRVRFKIKGEYKEKLVHRLVAEAFIPKRRGRRLVNHIDANKMNNHVSNLEWVTQKENMQHASKMGLLANNGRKRSISDDIVKKIASEYTGAWGQQRQIAKEYGINYGVVHKILKGLRRENT